MTRGPRYGKICLTLYALVVRFVSDNTSTLLRSTLPPLKEAVIKISVLFFALAALFSTCCQTVSGDLFIEMLQIGNDVVVTSSGTVDTTVLEFIMGAPSGGSILPNSNSFPNPFVITGFPFDESDFFSNPTVDLYFNANFGPVVGPTSFGFATSISPPDTGSGDLHGFYANSITFDPPFIIVPEGYVSGDFLSSQMTFLNSSFADLGVIEGTYNWSFEGNEVTLVIVVPLGLPPLLGDVNQDGEVAFSDIPAFIEILQAGSFLEEADTNQDGEVTFADIPAFIQILIAS